MPIISTAPQIQRRWRLPAPDQPHLTKHCVIEATIMTISTQPSRPGRDPLRARDCLGHRLYALLFIVLAACRRGILGGPRRSRVAALDHLGAAPRHFASATCKRRSVIVGGDPLAAADRSARSRGAGPLARRGEAYRPGLSARWPAPICGRRWPRLKLAATRTLIAGSTAPWAISHSRHGLGGGGGGGWGHT